jgi:hypothetical protein
VTPTATITGSFPTSSANTLSLDGSGEGEGAEIAFETETFVTEGWKSWMKRFLFWMGWRSWK